MRWGVWVLFVAVVCLADGFAYAAADAACQRQLARPQRPPLVVSFAADSAKLTLEDATRLGAFVDRELSGGAGAVCVFAQAEPYGDPDYNLTLARRRASAVVAAITSLGLDRTRLVVIVRAAEALAEATATGGRTAFALDRRVQLLSIDDLGGGGF